MIQFGFLGPILSIVLIASGFVNSADAIYVSEPGVAYGDISLKKQVPLSQFLSNLGQALADEGAACAVDTRREIIVAKHGHYIDRLGDDDKEACVSSLQAIEFLRCDKITVLYKNQIQVVQEVDVASETDGSQDLNNKLSQKVVGLLSAQIAPIRSETINGIDSTFSGTQCSLMRGLSGYFVKKKLISSVNQKLDEMSSQLAELVFVFEVPR